MYYICCFVFFFVSMTDYGCFLNVLDFGVSIFLVNLLYLLYLEVNVYLQIITHIYTI